MTTPRTLRPVPSRTDEPEASNSNADSRAANELGMRELLSEDFATYDKDLTQPGLWAVVAHRLGARAQNESSTLARGALGVAHRVLSRSVDLVWGIDLPREVQLGRRVRIWHSGCMQLHAKSIGNDVHIRHDTTLGPLRMRDAEKGSLPVVEDRADLGSGVCVLGDVRVGHDAMVGANSLVIKNVPPRSTVMGVPARILPT